jgi:hypothetical protein
MILANMLIVKLANAMLLYPGEFIVQAFIGTKLLSNRSAQPRAKPFEIYDRRLRGFTLRVQPSGVRAYYARLGSNHRIALGRVGVLGPEEAREKCQIVLVNVANGRRPMHGLLGIEDLTLGQFIDETYAPWAKANRPRTATNTLEKLNRLYRSWLREPSLRSPSSGLRK